MFCCRVCHKDRETISGTEREGLGLATISTMKLVGKLGGHVDATRFDQSRIWNR